MSSEVLPIARPMPRMRANPLQRSSTSAFVRPCGTNLVGNASIVRPISQLVDFTQLIALRNPGATMTLRVGPHGGTHTLEIILSRNTERAQHKKKYCNK
jgi:hypothetical protein